MISLAMERRRSERSKVMLTVNIEGAHLPLAGRLTNVSSNGACIVGPALSEGAPVLLQRNGMDVSGHVTWAAGAQSGVSFARPVDPHSVLRAIPSPRAQVTVANRRPGLKCRPLSQADITLLERCATAGAVR